MRISLQLSKHNFQTRFVTNFENVSNYLDTNESPLIQGFVIDLSCRNYHTILEQNPHEVIFKNNNYWLLIDDERDRGEANQMVTGMEISVIMIRLHSCFCSAVLNIFIFHRTRFTVLLGIWRCFH